MCTVLCCWGSSGCGAIVHRWQYLQLQPPIITHFDLFTGSNSCLSNFCGDVCVDSQALSLHYFLPHILQSIPHTDYICQKAVLILHGLITNFPYHSKIQFHITSSSLMLTAGSAFYTRSMSSPVSQLQWQSGLDYVYVATESSVSDVIVIITKYMCV